MIFKGFSIAKNCLRLESVLLMKKKKKKKKNSNYWSLDVTLSEAKIFFQK